LRQYQDAAKYPKDAQKGMLAVSVWLFSLLVAFGEDGMIGQFGQD